MTRPGPAVEKAFRDLGVEPDADRATVRKAWKAMVRAYHPDQVGADKAEANRRLADLNAAFDLVSAWSAQDLQAYAETRRTCRQAQERARKPNTRVEPERRAKAGSAKADRAKTASQSQKAKARQQQEQAARQNARNLDRADAAKRNAKRALARKTNPRDTTARAKFLATLLEIGPRAAIRELGFA